jgi:hypothetical protein
VGNLKDFSLVKRYKSDGGIFEVAWSLNGERVAASLSTNNVVLIDMRK